MPRRSQPKPPANPPKRCIYCGVHITRGSRTCAAHAHLLERDPWHTRNTTKGTGPR